jgi:hypothetical protein
MILLRKIVLLIQKKFYYERAPKIDKGKLVKRKIFMI